MSRKTKAAEFIQAEYPVTVTGRNFLVTEPMRNYAIEKIAKIDKFNIRIIDVNILMEIQKLEQRVEIVLKVDHILVRSEAVSDDMYISIDKAVDKMQTQLRKYRTRIREHQARGVREVDMAVNFYRSPTEAELGVEDFDEIKESDPQAELIERYRPHSISKRETIAVKTLTYAEAIMKMELSGDGFMLFRSEEDQKLKVIYRNEDGNFGIIEPALK